MKELYELKEKLCRELKEYGNREVSANSLEIIDKLAHSIKNIDKIIESYEESEYSGNYMRPNNGGYNQRNYMDGRGQYNRREPAGRYTYDSYSYHGDMIDELKDLMENAPDEKTRQEFHRFIQKMESM